MRQMRGIVQTLRSIPAVVDYWYTKTTCNHEHLYFDGGVLVCDRCYTEFPVSEALTKASGVFLRIQERLEEEERFNNLLKMAEAYQSDRNYNS